jgi:hypothetical protein
MRARTSDARQQTEQDKSLIGQTIVLVARARISRGFNLHLRGVL